MNSLIEYTLYNQSSKQQHYLKNSQNGKDGFWSRTDHLDSEYGDKVLTTNTMFFNMGQTWTLFVLWSSFSRDNDNRLFKIRL